MSAEGRPADGGRLLTGVAWVVLLLGLWVWGRDATEGPGGSSAPTTGDAAAVGRPLGDPLPPAQTPFEGGVVPRRVDVASIGVTAPVVPRGLDASGAVDPPPYGQPSKVGWYSSGTRPGAAGVALLVGHVDTESKPAVFYGLSAARPGETVRVTGTGGETLEFTIDDVQVFTRERFDPQKVYGPRQSDRAELRLITCGGTYDRKARTYTANVVVSAYLTGAAKG
ncbi:class F sortase [Streptomyces sp. ISL-98]|uniref:class F sortase n=1 Tax=Streptomyces sp. ISL-98 TaxID=2819192 RepID=UPI001BE868DF|nr:class F sortase [Streptomyces sp. ISL-98]MBT2510255.1 class F sortase [Streptomyces sp. ISL-98]